MPVLGPITTAVVPRRFSVIDLEWVPAQPMPVPVNTLVVFEGLQESVHIPLPVSIRHSEPLKLRLAACYTQTTDRDKTDEPVGAEHYECFSTMGELLDVVLTRANRGRWFYAHAGGLSDMEFVLDELLSEIKNNIAEEAGQSHTITLPTSDQKEIGLTRHEDRKGGDYRIRASFSGSSAIIVHVGKGKNAWHFIDSYWLLRDKLANIGKALKIGKGDTPLALDYLKRRFDKTKLEDLSQEELQAFFREAPIDVLTSYNKVDCEILWKAIAQFEAEILSLGGQLQQTIASTGMNLFRRAYLKQNIYTSERINNIAEESYFASRVEVVSRNCVDFKIYDINSSFPYAMTFPQPGKLLEVRNDIPDEWLEMADGPSRPDDPSEKKIFIADVTIEVPDHLPLPPLPYRMEGRVFFPTGRWRSFLTSTDIRLALREGCILHGVHEAYVFEPFFDLAGYANDIYGKRAASETDFRKLVLKYLLNSLYGKYAESPFKQEMLINPEEIDRAEMQLLQPGVWLREKVATIAHRHVPISTHITSIARRTLYDFSKECYRQCKPAYYYDTDSLNTQADLPTDEKRLGALKLEKKMLWGEFLAPKIYRGEGFELGKDGQWTPVKLAKAKGFSLGRSKQEAWEKWGQIASGDQVGIQRQIRMRELYRTGLQTPIDILVIKALTFEMLSKRFHYPDGETRPWHIKELVSGQIYPKGFDFDPELESRLDTTTRAMLEAAV